MISAACCNVEQSFGTKNPVEKAILGKTILLTGAGGFIGSALAGMVNPYGQGFASESSGC
jgi:NADPH:quinone reductase-like Zn-dependent oxidoreductase